MSIYKNVGISQLQPGMTVNESLDCGKKECPRYSSCKILLTVKKGKKLTSYDIKLLITSQSLGE